MSKAIVTVLLVLYVLGRLDVIDFHVCIGKPGSCAVELPSKPLVSA